MISPTIPVQAMENSLVRVYGRVMDSSGDPIPNAHIILWNIQQEIAVKANASGRYEINVTGWKSYRVYAYGDDPSTSGLDYVPAYRQLSVGETAVNVSFTLLPGASINAEGYILSLENLYPPIAITFTVTDQYSLLSENKALTKYDGGLLSNYILGLSKRTMVVPSNILVQVQVDIYYLGEIERRFIIDLPPETLIQGDLLSLDLREHTLWADVDTVYGYITSARALAEGAEGRGFYVAYERNMLSKAKDLVDDAGSALTQAALDEAFSDLREAYLMVRSVEQGLVSLYVNASQSVVFITPFLGLTAVVIAAIITDDRYLRLIMGLALYGSLLGLLYVLYPGYTTLQKSTFNPWAGTPWEALLALILVATSFLVVFPVVHWLPHAFREKTLMEGLRPISALAAALSLAARNLRRRRLRTLLTAAFMLTSVFAFMALTSLALERGLFVRALRGRRGQAPSEGFLLRRPSVAETMPFMPITSTVLQQLEEWLGERPEAALVAVKLENIPKGSALGPLTSASGLVYVWGILGVYPSLEAQVTGMDRIVEEGQFLRDEDRDGILVSGWAVNYLQVGVNDTLMFHGQNFTVTGIFDSGKLDGLKDLDGEPLIPYYLEFGVPRLLSPPRQVVIVHGETSRRLPGVVVSRVDVQARSPGEIMTLARMMILSWSGFEAYASVAGEIRHLLIGEYYLAGGFASAMFPLILVVLNVGSLMLGSVFERKREVATMSSLGMNPFHISAVFVAEALVIGIVAGSLGYILGLTSYRFMAVFMPFGVKQKVEPIWGILALSLSVAAAVLGSALPATKASIIVTPSLLKRWKIEEKPETAQEPWLLNLPLRIRGQDLGAFFTFMEKRLQRSTSREFGGIENLQISGEGAAIRLSFTYISTEKKVVTDNELFLVKGRLPNRYIIRLAIKARLGALTVLEAKVRETAGFIRRLILQYSTEQRPLRG